MLESVAIAPLNRLLRQESWARIRLEPYAGKTIRFCLPPLPDLILTIQPSGELSSAEKAIAEDAVVMLTPSLLPRLLACDEQAYREFQASGDRDLAEQIVRTVSNLHWDAEQELSVLVGDILARRIVRSGKNLIHWHAEAFRNVLQAANEYLTEERQLLEKPVNLHNFIGEVKALQEKTACLEKRVNALIV